MECVNLSQYVSLSFSSFLSPASPCVRTGQQVGCAEGVEYLEHPQRLELYLPAGVVQEAERRGEEGKEEGEKGERTGRKEDGEKGERTGRVDGDNRKRRRRERGEMTEEKGRGGREREERMERNGREDGEKGER